jgi:hypothetical protein
MRAAQAGVSKFEFALVVAIIGILGGLLLHRLTEVEAAAERLQVDLTVRHMRIGLALAIGERLMQGREDSLAELLERNPADFLGGAGLAEGWRYEPSALRLTYRPRQPEAFEGRKELQWRLIAAGQAGGRVMGLRLVETTPAG